MGSSSEAEVLFKAEDAITDRTKSKSLYYVGRLRNKGLWQLTFYGPAGLQDALQTACHAALGQSDRAFKVGSKTDPGWRYYKEFLYPNSERMQWISDRGVVDSLAKHGDPLTKARRVDHWIYFTNDGQITAFIVAAKALGFEIQEPVSSTENDTERQSDDDQSDPEQKDGDFSLNVQIHRVDHVELGKIHEVVMNLYDLAKEHGGDYDGWETSVEKET
jgi:hypothetical protein